ncbi:hypothetical protein [Lacinutrix sp. Hel_I_90]|uniref:hypothetical protein n=1 Tax=Lacinutrix sp. Hel_I_90 TaxID=1249999 RepID=UPI0005C84CE0|nr:hypothetical protein [Lacinutrix sp. Hel_I_90]
MKASKLIFSSVLALLIFSCSYDSESDLIEVTNETGQINNPDNNGSGITVNYINNIKSIMQSSCIGCHSSPPVNGAPFALINFSQVSQQSGSILNVMRSQSGSAGAMPPSGRLPQATIDLVQEWINNGKPEN